jgi:hypothetical protein
VRTSPIISGGAACHLLLPGYAGEAPAGAGITTAFFKMHPSRCSNAVTFRARLSPDGEDRLEVECR